MSLERHCNPSFRGVQATRGGCRTKLHLERSSRGDGVLQFQRHSWRALPCLEIWGYMSVHFLLRHLERSTFRITILTFRSLKRSQIIYQQSWLTREVSGDWQLANVTPIDVEDRKDDLGNYEPVGLASELWKVMEQIVLSATFKTRIGPGPDSMSL